MLAGGCKCACLKVYINVKNGLHQAAAPNGASTYIDDYREKTDGKIREMDCGKNAPAWNSLKTVIL